MLPFASPLSPATATRWSALAVPGWVTRGVLTAGWLLAFVAAMLGDTAPCTPLDPAVCGPEPWFTWWVVIFMATPVLLLWMPLPGCAAGMIFALADLTYDHVGSARFAFGLHGLACAVTAVWLLRAAAAQKRVAVGAAGGARTTLPTGEAVLDSPPPRTLLSSPRLVFAAVLLVLGGALTGWYELETRTERAHLAVAERVTGRVVAVDDESFTITLDVTTAAGTRPVTTGVLDLQPYPQGSITPVLLDPADPTWSRLVAEPQDATGWQSFGLLALLLAAVLALRELYARRALRRLRTDEHPALRVWFVPDETGHLIFPDDGARPELSHGRPTARLPFSWAEVTVDDDTDEDRWDQEKWDEDRDGPTSPDEEKAAFGRFWRGEEDPEASESDRYEPIAAEPAVLLGSLHDRGWAALVNESGTLVSSGPLKVGNLRALDEQSRRDRLRDRLLAMLPFGDRAVGRGEHALGDPAANPADDPVQDSVQDTAHDTVRNRSSDPAGYLSPPGVPIRTTSQGDLDLPLVAPRPMRTRRLGTVMMVAGLIGAPAALLLLDLSWWERGIIILLGGRLLLGGVGRALQHVRLTQNNLEIHGSYRVRLVPWERVHGARLDGARLLVACEPDLTAEVGPFESDADSATQAHRAERLGAAILHLRERALLGGAPIRTARSRPGPVWALAATYLAATCLALWVSI